MEEALARVFRTFNRGADGVVTFTEYEAGHRELVASSFARLDFDGDGRLRLDELNVAAWGRSAPPARDVRPPAALSQDTVARLDQDGDAALVLGGVRRGSGGTLSR